MIKEALILLAAAGTPAPPSTEPYSCKMYYEAQRKCSYNTVGKCYIQSEVDRLRQQCARDGGKP